MHFILGETPVNRPAPLGWRGWVLIMSVAAVVCCFELGDARVLTEHEINVAAGAKQMILEGDWLLPKIGDQLWLEKPPMLHWLVAISATLFGGFTEVSVRLPSVLAGLAVVALMTWLSLRWFGQAVAIVSGCVQTTLYYFINYARLTEADMLLALIVVGAIAVFVCIQSIGSTPAAPSSPRLVILFWALVGLSNSAKGFGFGAFMILAPCGVYLIWQRDRIAWRRMISLPGFLLAAVLAVSWPLLAALRSPEALALWRFLILERAVSGAGFGKPWWYYLGTWIWQLSPWTPVLLLAVGPSLRRAKEEVSPDRFLWCWALVPIVLLSLSRGKHHHYLISCLPAFTPLLALGLLRCGRWITTAYIMAAIGLTLYYNGSYLPRRDSSRDDRNFLTTLRGLIPANAALFAAGSPGTGQEIARHIFYVDPPPKGVFKPADLKKYLGDSGVFYVIARQHSQPELEMFGQTAVVAQSRRTRREKSPADRFTLFRIERSLSRPEGMPAPARNGL